MLCKACGHKNYSMAQKCGSCGVDLGNNEMMQMFQAQAQNAKGIVTPEEAAGPNGGNGAHAESSGATDGLATAAGGAADDFFADLSHSQPPKREAIPATDPREHSNSQSKQQVAQSFFAQMESVESQEPAFGTDIGPLRDEDKKLADHPLYSPPVNPHVEAYLARRSKMN